MENVTIISHLTPKEWKMSWEDKVVEDTKEKMRAYQLSNCFWGHFKNDNEFTICHHKDGEIKSMSLGLYFNGTIENDEHGCKIVGKFGKKFTANLFLGVGGALCTAALIGSIARQDIEVAIVSAVLLLILFIVYFSKPQKAQQTILKHLEKISFDSEFHNKNFKKSSKSRKKHSIRENATLNVQGSVSDAEPEK